MECFLLFFIVSDEIGLTSTSRENEAHLESLFSIAYNCKIQFLIKSFKIVTHYSQNQTTHTT